MSAVIRNLTVGAIAIDDLDGLTILGSADLDLTTLQVPQTTIAASSDLLAEIVAGNIIFLDGQGNAMSQQESEDALANMSSVTPAVFLQNGGSNVAGTPHNTLNFGDNLTVTDDGSGKATIDASGGGGSFLQRFTFQADQFDNPVTSDWAVDSLAPAYRETGNSALIVRRFDDTTEEGVGGAFTIPPGAVSVVLYFKSRAHSTPGGTVGVQPTLYHRSVPDNATVTSWSSALNLTVLSFTTNTFFQYDTQTISLATLGWSAGQFVQFELTRRGTQGGDTLSGDWDLLELIVEFTT